MIGTQRQRSVARLGALSLLVVACAGPAVVGPSAEASANALPVTPPPSTQSVAVTASPATPSPTAQPTVPPDPDPSHLPAGFIESFAQLDETVGGHGGAPEVALPASVAIDYWVSGTCDFRIDIFGGVSSTPVASFTMRMLGSTESGTWPVRIKAGRYTVVPEDAPGCLFSVTVRAAT